MTRRFPRRRHSPIVWPSIALVALLALDIAWHLLPWLLAIGAAVFVCRRWQLHSRAVASLRGSVPVAAPVRGHVVADDAEQLRAELDRVRGQVTRLEDAANRPIEAVIASYEHIASRYGDATVGRTGGRK